MKTWNGKSANNWVFFRYSNPIHLGDGDLPEVDLSNVSMDSFTHALSDIYRYNGASRCSVLAHSYFLAKYLHKIDASPFAVQYALLHDFAEAIVGDLGWASKTRTGDEWRALEEVAEIAALKRFQTVDDGITFADIKLVKKYDTLFCSYERFYYFNSVVENKDCGLFQFLSHQGELSVSPRNFTTFFNSVAQEILEYINES